MASKSTDIRPKITMACTECKERNYITRKNRRNDPDRMELKKYCPRCRKHRRTARPADLARPRCFGDCFADRFADPHLPRRCGSCRW